MLSKAKVIVLSELQQQSFYEVTTTRFPLLSLHYWTPHSGVFDVNDDRSAVWEPSAPYMQPECYFNMTKGWKSEIRRRLPLPLRLYGMTLIVIDLWIQQNR